MQGGLICQRDRTRVLAWTIVLYFVLGNLPQGGCSGRLTKQSPSRSLLVPQCKLYEPGQSCAMNHTEGPAQPPFCHKGDGVPRDCNFNTSFLRKCPLVSEGKFLSVEDVLEAGANCGKPFMRMSENISRPGCDRACCSAELAGSFAPQFGRLLRQQQQSVHFQPHNATCLYHAYNWRAATECLAGSRLVIAGDSIMRQFFSAGIALFRGQETAMDYNKHAHGRYRVCNAADQLSFGSFQPNRWQIPLEEVKSVFGKQDKDPFRTEWQDSSAFEVDYLWAPRYMDLTPNLLEFHSSFGSGSPGSGERLSYVVFAGFWEDQATVSEDFLVALDTIRASAEFLIVIGIPRVRLYGWKKDNARTRNERTRQWVASRTPLQDGNVFYLDFDHLAHAENAPKTMGSLNWHYQCFLDHGHIEEAEEHFGSVRGAWHWPEQPDHPFPSVWTDDRGTCTDEMDSSLWQIVLNLLCNRRTQNPDVMRLQ